MLPGRMKRMNENIRKFKDGGPGSGIKGHTTAEENIASKEDKVSHAKKLIYSSKRSGGSGFISENGKEALFNYRDPSSRQEGINFLVKNGIKREDIFIRKFPKGHEYQYQIGYDIDK